MKKIYFAPTPWSSARDVLEDYRWQTPNGDVTKIYSELYELTKSDLNEWGVKFHELVMGKAHYDLLIDDKAMNSRNATLETISDFLKE